MQRIIILILIGFFLSGCTFLRVHKRDIEQGNIIVQSDVAKLRRGMTETQVKEVMGTPVLKNIFTPNRVEYVYTFQKGHGEMQIERVSCLFKGGILREIKTY